jgi:hypothetical protein
MKTTHLTVFPAYFALALALPAQERTPIDPARDCSHVIQIELGDAQFKPGDSISIQELRGSTDQIEKGATYCVTGTYTLASQDEANLSFFATTTNRTSSPVDPAQTVRVKKGTGTFSLVKHMTDNGYLHLSFYPSGSGGGFGGVYFGHGQWVLHNRHSGNLEPGAHSASSDDEPVSSAGANQVLFNYLGNPVAPPVDMDPAYTKEGLEQGMKTAAQNAGIALVRVQIDDSEFPFLIGVIFANPGDKPKLKEQIQKMRPYAISGGVGDEITYAMNIVGRFPPNVSQRIYRRMMLREAVLHEKLTNAR